MEITETLRIASRGDWRHWLEAHHHTKKEIWLITSRPSSGQPRIPYLDTVEEALCFGWIDGIAKKLDEQHTAQRFTPRRPRSHWTELNKERARRLITQGQMTDAGLAVLPDLSIESFRIADDIVAALRADAQTWQNFERFPEVYKRIRIGYIEEVRAQPDVFKTRLANFVKKTHDNKLFGGMV